MVPLLDLPDEIRFFPDLLCLMILWIWSIESFFTRTTGLGLFSKSCIKPSLSSFTLGWTHNWPSAGPLPSLSRLICRGRSQQKKWGQEHSEMPNLKAKLKFTLMKVWVLYTKHMTSTTKKNISKSIMWIKQNVKSENRNVTSESDVSSYCRSNDKAKNGNNTAVWHARDARPPKSFTTGLCFYQLTIQFAHLFKVHHTNV